MSQNRVYDLLKMLEIALEEGYSVLKYTVVNKREIEELIDRIYQAMPQEMQEAKVFIRDKERLQQEAQAQANDIIQKAQMEADRKLSESDQKKAVERECARVKNELIEECNKIKHVAIQDADAARLQATEESMKIREGANLYAQRVLTELEEHITSLHQGVKDCQIYVEKMKNDTYGTYAKPNQ